jgi:hypothetical protein
MKDYCKIVLEMKLPEAMKVFSISGNIPDERELKLMYNKLAMKNHPDRGGNVEMMKSINVAYDILKSNSGKNSSSSSGMNVWDELEKKKNVNVPAIVMGILKKKLNLGNFTAYFNKLFNKEFKIENLEYYQPDISAKWSTGSYVSVKCDFSDPDREIVFFLDVEASFNDIMYKVLLPGDEDQINMFITTEILYNRKKIKITSKKYNIVKDSAALSNPEIIFPSKVLLKRVQKSESSDKVSKKDFITLFTLKFKGKMLGSKGDNIAIPLKNFENGRLNIERGVLDRVAYWTFWGVTAKNLRIVPSQSFYLFETPKTIGFLDEMVSTIQKMDDPDKIKAYIEKKKVEYKHFTDSPESDLK